MVTDGSGEWKDVFFGVVLFAGEEKRKFLGGGVGSNSSTSSSASSISISDARNSGGGVWRSSICSSARVLEPETADFRLERELV